MNEEQFLKCICPYKGYICETVERHCDVCSIYHKYIEELNEEIEDNKIGNGKR